MKYPIPERLIEKAKDYYQKANGYIHNHPGWEDEFSKQKRAICGLVAEYWIINFLEINDVKIVVDQTSFDENDDFDFVFKSNKYDVKTSYAGLPISITKTYEKKEIDFFVGTKIDWNLEYLELLGVVSKKEAVSKTYFLKKGDQISNSKFNCKFDFGAYFFTGVYEGFFSHFEIEPHYDSVADYWRRLYFARTDAA